MTHRRLSVLGVLVLVAALGLPGRAQAGCGCDKKAPPHTMVRPPVGWEGLVIHIFDDPQHPRISPGARYRIKFGDRGLAMGKAVLWRDVADGLPHGLHPTSKPAKRPAIEVRVPNQARLGPNSISVFGETADTYRETPLWTVGAASFTLAGRPISLSERNQTVVRTHFRAGVGLDGTLYIPVDVTRVTNATTFVGGLTNIDLSFAAADVIMYNDQGFLMQALDQVDEGSLFKIVHSAKPASSDALYYWRHSFADYKANHALADFLISPQDPDWHADNSYHVNHNAIVLGIHGKHLNGSGLAPGAFDKLVVWFSSRPSDCLDTRDPNNPTPLDCVRGKVPGK